MKIHLEVYIESIYLTLTITIFRLNTNLNKNTLIHNISIKENLRHE
nr:MAG TPA: hypothetical protein [Caudoviricetes sp.]